MSAPDERDLAVLADWWRHVLATGALPPGVAAVHTRLVRQVGRGELPSGPVFVKVMAFPRRQDRLRYLLRPLPAAHEARLLGAVAQTGIACPEVVLARTARRGPWPHRSLLVLRALPVAAADPTPPAVRLQQQAALARRLLDAGWWHPDLNPDNFVRLQDGRLAVLDLQSMRAARHRVRAGRKMAARLLLEARDLAPGRAREVLVRAGLVAAGDDRLLPAATALALAFLRTRVRRCLVDSTDYVRSRHGTMVEHRQRVALPPGRWHRGGAELRRCWLGQRLLAVFEQRPPVLAAWRKSSWWLPRAQSVYVAATVGEDRLREELQTLAQAFDRYRWLWHQRPGHGFEELRLARARHLED